MFKEEILIMGTGAMASLFAARISRVCPVKLLGTWHEGLAAIDDQGIRVLEIEGGETQANVTVVREAGELTAIQFALVLVKSWQTERAARSLAKCLAEDGVALSLQNGLGNLEMMQEILGEGRSTLGVTTTGATLLEPGLVRHGGDGPITLGPHDRNNPFADLLRQAGFDVQRQDDLNGLIWSKLAVNAAINPLTALLEIRNGQLLAQQTTRELMQSAAQEVARLADVLGIRLAMDDPVAFAFQVAERTSDNVSSMLQDIQRGAPTEIDAICGAIVRIAGQHEVDTPINWGLWNLVKAKANLGDEE
jgi:2-dehydropantoate 2-reductase